MYVAVVGPSDPAPPTEAAAEEVGRLLGRAGGILVCGGLGGVMAAAARGAKQSGGTTLGLLPGRDRGAANAWIDIAVPTGLGEGRNVLVVATADAVVAVGKGYGTLSEIALALRDGVPVVGLSTWEVPGVQPARAPAEAVRLALRAGV